MPRRCRTTAPSWSTLTTRAKEYATRSRSAASCARAGTRCSACAWTPPASPVTMVDPLDPTRRRTIPEGSASRDLLVPIFRSGRRVYDPPPLLEVRKRVSDELSRFHSGVKRFVNPHRFPVGLERGLHDLRTRLILEARTGAGLS